MMHTKPNGGLIKAETGIPGFDAITGGGLPLGRTTLITGSPGSGKTIFALQTLVTRVQRGEPGIFVTFQESPRQIMENAASCGWDLPELEKDKLVIMDSRIRPNVFKSIELYLTGMMAGLRLLANEMQARWMVFDSIDTLFALLNDRVSERQEIFRLRDWLLENDFSAILTAQADREESSLFQSHGFMQFTADCTVHLQQQHHPAGAETTRSLRVVKYRGSAFVEREAAFRIGASGIEVTGENPRTKTGRGGARSISGIEKDIVASRAAFQARIKSLTHQLEMKQSELDFLLRETKSSGRAALRRAETAPRPRKGLSPALGVAAQQRRAAQPVVPKQA